MKVVIFGTGKISRRLSESVGSNIEITAYLDNDVLKQGKEYNGIIVLSPTRIKEIDFDIVVIGAACIKQMKQQLTELGISADIIWSYIRFEAFLNKENVKKYGQNLKIDSYKSVAVFSNDLDYDGASMVVCYAAQVLKEQKFNVDIFSPKVNEKYADEMSKKGFNITIIPYLKYMSAAELSWATEYDYLFFNTFLMLPCVSRVGGLTKSVWWIHEASVFFDKTISEFGKLTVPNNVRVCAVSSISKYNFELLYPKRVDSIMPYGIPDTYSADVVEHDKTNFAMIGTIDSRKNQKELIEAIRKIDKKYRDCSEFWIIGSGIDSEYGRSLISECKDIKNVLFKGVISRDEMRSMFPQIDVIVCTSNEDPLPVVITEGFMNGKICISSSATGFADIINNGENGYIYHLGDTDELASYIISILNNRGKDLKVGQNARVEFVNNFSFERFKDRIISELKMP